MKNRKLMLSIIAASTAAAIGLGSVYAASSAGNEIRTNETETKETGIEIEETEETETETEETESPAESESNSPSILEILTGSDRKNADAEAEAYEDVGVYDGLMMSAADGGNYYAEPAIPNWNTEEYSTVDETGFRDVKLYPLSTFGMDVDTASYALLRRNTLDDTLSWMPKDGVRIEEMINYFNYEYDMPDGDETFSITAQIADCPWNDQTKLMLVGLQAKDIPQEAIKDQNLVFLVDTSGSMYDADKLPLAVEALKYLLTEMDENDSIAIVTYAGSSEIALDPTKCTKEGKAQIIRTLDALTANGGTYGEAGIRTAYDLAQESFVEGGNNRVLLLTDGDFNLGQTDDSELVDLVQEKAEGRRGFQQPGPQKAPVRNEIAERIQGIEQRALLFVQVAVGHQPVEHRLAHRHKAVGIHPGVEGIQRRRERTDGDRRDGAAEDKALLFPVQALSALRLGRAPGGVPAELFDRAGEPGSGSAFRQSKNCRDTSLLVRSQTSRKTAANSTASSAAVRTVFFCGPGSRPPASAVRKNSRLSMTTAVGAITQLACTGRSSSTQKAAALRKNTVLFMFRGAPLPCRSVRFVQAFLASTFSRKRCRRMMKRSWVPCPIGPHASKARTSKTSRRPSISVRVLSAQTFMPTGVAASWLT